MSKRKAYRPAIDLCCKNCIVDPYQTGTWRAQVEKCKSANCALFLVRPRPIAPYPIGQPKSLDVPPELGLKGLIDEHSARERL